MVAASLSLGRSTAGCQHVCWFDPTLLVTHRCPQLRARPPARTKHRLRGAEGRQIVAGRDREGRRNNTYRDRAGVARTDFNAIRGRSWRTSGQRLATGATSTRARRTGDAIRCDRSAGSRRSRPLAAISATAPASRAGDRAWLSPGRRAAQVPCAGAALALCDRSNRGRSAREEHEMTDRTPVGRAYLAGARAASTTTATASV